MTDAADTPSVEELYGQIARLLIRVLPRDWEEAVVEFTWADEDVADTTATYRNEQGKKQPLSTFDIGTELDDAFLALGEMMEASDHPRWESAHYHLTRSGAFHLDFRYPEEGATATGRPWDRAGDG